jgi:hypothetical protein
MLASDADKHMPSTTFEPKLLLATALNQQPKLATEEPFGCRERLRWSEPRRRLIAHHNLLSSAQYRGGCTLKTRAGTQQMVYYSKANGEVASTAVKGSRI